MPAARVGRRQFTAISLLVLLIAGATASSAPAASKTVKVPVPDAGDLTVAHLTLGVKGSGRLNKVPGPRLRKPRGAAGLTVVGGVKRLGSKRLLVSVVIVRRAQTRTGPGKLAVKVRLPRGVRPGRVAKRSIATSIVASEQRPPYCNDLPKSFRYVAAKPLLGPDLRGFGARDVARFASYVGCRTFGKQAAFLASFRGENGENGSGGGSGTSEESAPGGCAEGETCEDDEESRPTISQSLRASGTATRDAGDPRRFSYSITFNEPVTGYRISINGGVRCPPSPYADEAIKNGCPPESVSPGHGLTCEQPPGSMSYEFVCETPPPGRGGTGGGPPVPAGAAINGAWTTEPASPPPGPGSISVVGLQGTTESTPQTIPVS